MSNPRPTKSALLIGNCLKDRGIEVIFEHWDGHKHVDIFVPSANLYIEVDGLQHYISAKHIMSDIERDYWSHKEGFKTFRIPSFVALTNYRSVVIAIEKIVGY